VARQKIKKTNVQPAKPQPPSRDRSKWLWPAAIVAAVTIFYWIPITSSEASIQWDAVDVHYSSQKYFADHLRAGEMPFWTPYIFSGFPFLADPQAGAWYPPNWPFFLMGVTPRGIQFELLLHALLACLGAFLFFQRYVSNRTAAMVGALAYGFSGFFAEHSSHVGMFCTAAGLPWLLLCFDRALENGPLPNTILAGLAGGTMILAGHFQAALYSFAALGLFAIAKVIERPKTAVRLVSILAGTMAIALLLSMIQNLPGLELAAHSLRAGANYATSHERILQPSALFNFIWPNTSGFFNREAGAGITNASYYLYSGFLLIPLAALGLKNKALRIPGLLLTVLPLWYMLGPDGGLYRLGAIVPGLHRVRAPIHFLFVAILGLALLAASGAAWLMDRWKMRWFVVLLPALFFADVFYWNSLTNPFAYVRNSFDDLYGNRERIAAEKVLPSQPSLTRFEMPADLTVFGPLNHPLDLRLEAVYGYNPLELQTYAEYMGAAETNRKLLNGLNVSRQLNAKLGAIEPNPNALPRGYFARKIIQVSTPAESLALLPSLDPAQAAIVQGKAPQNEPDPQATVSSEPPYIFRYSSSKPALLKISIPYFPGWTATIAGRQQEILRVDHALMGVMVPAGQNELILHYQSNRFPLGATMSGITLLVSMLVLAWTRRRHSRVSSDPSKLVVP
jgi:Bacterial membrane protein YfhO